MSPDCISSPQQSQSRCASFSFSSRSLPPSPPPPRLNPPSTAPSRSALLSAVPASTMDASAILQIASASPRASSAADASVCSPLPPFFFLSYLKGWFVNITSMTQGPMEPMSSPPPPSVTRRTFTSAAPAAPAAIMVMPGIAETTAAAVVKGGIVHSIGV